MNVRAVVTQAFFSEWLRLQEDRWESEERPWLLFELEYEFRVSSWERVFDFDKVQDVVDKDLKEVAGRERSVRERYHRTGLRLISRLYADRLYIIHEPGREIGEAIMRKALEELKIAWGCPIYPCARERDVREPE